MDEVTFDNHYQAGHTYRETWAKTEYYCPGCGLQCVWHDTSTGDYYVGEQHICTACALAFYMPSNHTIGSKDHNGQQRLKALRAAVKGEPSRDL